MKTLEVNPLLCDPQAGVCEVAMDSGSDSTVITKGTKQIRVLYFTDPICSSCWGIEPQLRKLKLEYGDYLDFEYHMGGLVPSWKDFNSGGITKPSHVAHHWDEVSQFYEMPIDGDVWLEDPLDSSYPPSIAFVAARMQSAIKANTFLRRIREMVFVEKKNVCRWEHLEQAAIESNLNLVRFKADYEGKANDQFRNDLELTKSARVRGFPTLVFVDGTSRQTVVYGFRPYEFFEQAVLTLIPDAKKKNISTSPENIFSIYPTLTTKEFSVLTNRTKEESAGILDALLSKEYIQSFPTKNGILWKLNKK